MKGTMARWVVPSTAVHATCSGGGGGEATAPQAPPPPLFSVTISPALDVRHTSGDGLERAPVQQTRPRSDRDGGPTPIDLYPDRALRVQPRPRDAMGNPQDGTALAATRTNHASARDRSRFPAFVPRHAGHAG